MTSTLPDGKAHSSGQMEAEAPLSLRNNPLAQIKELQPGVPNPIYLAALDQKKREWAAWVDHQYTACKNARYPFEQQWYINYAFVAGKQYVSPIELPGVGFRLSSPKAPAHRVRLVINKVRTAVRTECSKLTSNKAIPIVVPKTNEDEDFSAARVGEQLTRNHFANTDFEENFRNFVWWGVVTGNSFMKSYWDPGELDYDNMALPPPPVGPDGQPVDPRLIESIPTLKAMFSKAEPAKGKIMMGEVINPFHIFVPDLLSPKLEDQPYVIHVTTRSPLWVEKKFGFKPTADARAANTIMDGALMISKGSEDHLDAVLVKEMWIKPNAHKDFPDGGVVTVINDKSVQCIEEWPLPFREYPFYKYSGIPTGGFYTDSSVVDLIPLQKEYNRTRSQMVEIKNTMQKAKFFYPKGSVDMRKVNTESGQAIPYTAGFNPPTPFPGVEVPQSMQQELDRLTSDFDDISGQHEISRGNTPAQVTSGTAIAFLQEQDDTKLAYQVFSIEHCMQRMGTHYLKYVAKYWDDARLVRITGKDSNFESLMWKGNDLKGNTDVKIQSGSALPFSKAARQAMVTEFMQNGWLPPESGLEMLDMGGYEKVLDELLVDKRQAQRENMKMANLDPSMAEQALQPPVDEAGNPVVGPDGNPMDPATGQPWMGPQPAVPVNSWDNHAAHYQYHNQYRKTQQFELLSPAQKQQFELHVQLHQYAAMGGMMNEQGDMMQPGEQPQEEQPDESEEYSNSPEGVAPSG